MKVNLIFGLTLVTSFFLLIFSLLSNDRSDEIIVHKEDKPSFYVVGENQFESTGEINVYPISLETLMNKNAFQSRFLLINDNQAIASNERDRLLELIESKQIIVFLFGKNISQTDVMEKLGVSFESFQLSGSSEIEYPLFGYGFSETDQAFFPFFLGTNAEQNKNERRRFEKIMDYFDMYHSRF